MCLDQDLRLKSDPDKHPESEGAALLHPEEEPHESRSGACRRLSTLAFRSKGARKGFCWVRIQLPQAADDSMLAETL